MLNINDVENKLQKLYDENEHVVVDFVYLSDLKNDEDNLKYIGLFHPKEVYMVERDDAWFCGIRANHFIVERGFSEMFPLDDTCYLISANHKGMRAYVLINAGNEDVKWINF